VMSHYSWASARLTAVGLSLDTGLHRFFIAGSVTTFSSFMYDVFNAFNNSHRYNHNGVKNVSLLLVAVEV
jgi:fluoride ion exporter CrcB/FEX